MNGDAKKKFVPVEEVKLKFGMAGEYGTSVSKKNLIDGKKELQLGTVLSKNIESFIEEAYFADKTLPEDFNIILGQMFALMHHHKYGVLYNILKKFR